MTSVSTSYSNSERLVLQIIPELPCGLVQINGKGYPRTGAYIFIPESVAPNTISCPLNYFQQSLSLPERWIADDASQKIKLDGIENLKEVVTTFKLNGNEKVLSMPKNYGFRLLEYFRLDICHNTNSFKGFDCYAFVNFLADLKYCAQNPEFEYSEKDANDGDFVVLTNDRLLPDSIKHWALYLGNELYLSKFGKTGEGSESLLSIMDLKGMMTLYDCKFIYVANPKIRSVL